MALDYVPGVAVDPGLATSAMVSFRATPGQIVPPFGVVPIEAVEGENASARWNMRRCGATGWMLAIEVMPGIYGPSTGADQVKTERWAGRFIEAHSIGWEDQETRENVWGPPVCIEVNRANARAVVTGSSRASDSQVRAAIIDLYGGQEKAFGRRCPKCKGVGSTGNKSVPCRECNGTGWPVPRGPLHGWTGTHLFAALAVAIAAMEPKR